MHKDKSVRPKLTFIKSSFDKFTEALTCVKFDKNVRTVIFKSDAPGMMTLNSLNLKIHSLSDIHLISMALFNTLAE